MKRLFFALWPGEETRKQIDTLNQSVKSQGLKKVKSANLHVTLLFLGNTDAKTELMLRQMAESICVQPIVLNFDRLEFWRKPRVLCLTAQQYDPQLDILIDALKNIVEQCGIQIEERRYQPHITLARKAHRLIDMQVLPIQWPSDSFCLIESCSTADGVDYQVLQRW